MEQITEKQLIESLQQLKTIKPRKEWVSLLKSQILAEKQVDNAPTQKARFAGFAEPFSSLFFQKKLTYSLAALLILIVGVTAFAQYAVPGDTLFPLKSLAEKSEAALTGKPELQSNVAVLVNRIHDLAELTRDGRTDNIPSAISEVNTNAKDVVQNLKKAPANDTKTINEIAGSLKTLSDVPGTDLSASQDMESLYQDVAKSEIAYLQGRTLTDDQKTILADAETLYGQGKYNEAFQKVYEVYQQINIPN